LSSVDRESSDGAARLSRGGSPESRGAGGAVEAEDLEAVSPGVISAFGVPSSELETVRRILGGAPSLLLEEVFEGVFDELLDELLKPSSELELARRSLGRSGSLSFEELDELPDARLELSSELDAARRNEGLSPFEAVEDLLAELPLELFDEDDDELSGDLGSGLVSSVCSDASECSSAVPAFTIVIVVAL
jgi:hypothetical protein